MWIVGEVGESDCVRHSVASVTSDVHSGTDGHRHTESDAVLSNELVGTWLLSADGCFISGV
jgi:hypothetical protein